MAHCTAHECRNLPTTMRTLLSLTACKNSSRYAYTGSFLRPSNEIIIITNDGDDNDFSDGHDDDGEVVSDDVDDGDDDDDDYDNGVAVVQ